MRWSLMCACMALVGFGCSSPTEPEPVWFEGTIVARDVTIPSGDPPSIHVMEDELDECGVVFLVRPSTIIRERGSLFRRASYSDLQVGTEVRLTSGIILDSCPGQSVAEIIEIER